MMAAGNGHLKVVIQLVNSGARVDATDKVSVLVTNEELLFLQLVVHNLWQALSIYYEERRSQEHI